VHVLRRVKREVEIGTLLAEEFFDLENDLRKSGKRNGFTAAEHERR